jgi:glycyl-tRNA synthetase beta chain
VFEIGTEELPPDAAWDGARQLGERAPAALAGARIPAGPAAAYATPRRLVLVIDQIGPRQEDLVREVRGPAVRAAFSPEGTPTAAAIGFARAQGVAPEALIRRTTPQGEYVYAVQRTPGGPTLEALPACLAALAAGLAFPNPMRWNGGGARFARPIRWLLALLDRQVVPVQFAGLTAGRITYGHPTLRPGPVRVPRAVEFEPQLRRHRVLLDPEARRRRIVAAAARAAAEAGGRPRLDEALLQESVQLVEWPEALAGAFAEDFLRLPHEVLITVMQHHQKYFAVEDAAGGLRPAFVALRDGGTRGLATVRQGNEWVLRARLADAQFFFKEDRKRALASRIPDLAGLLVHERLGTMEQKARRLQHIAARLAGALALSAEDTRHLARAALLSKADLVTLMVRELPELQGVMGGVYARLDGEPDPVADAVRDQYLPRGAAMPAGIVGACLALADKLDTLTSALAAGLGASGSEDPYGLRRAAHGIVALVLERRLRLDLRSVAAAALADGHPGLDAAARREAVEGTMELLRQRLRSALIESGISYDSVDAALAAGADDLQDAAARARALWAFRRRPEFQRLYTAYDRAARILPPGFDQQARPEGLEAPAERELWRALDDVRPQALDARAQGRYESALASLAALADPVDRFFTDVLVMAEDERVRRNRLALLAGVVALVQPIADLRRVVVKENAKGPA